MRTEEWTKIWHNSQLDVEFLQAFYVDHAFPRHSHDYYVISLVKQYADVCFDEQRLGQEREAVQQARRYIDEWFAQGISLTQLAEHVSLSPYYLLRVFRAEVGMPPYAYLESVRIRQAQRLIEAGKPLVEVAAEAGFSSQSHLTQRFRQIIGVTPGQYAQLLRQ
jgi:AraC-like DNA-binding protein